MCGAEHGLLHLGAEIRMSVSGAYLFQEKAVEQEWEEVKCKHPIHIFKRNMYHIQNRQEGG